MLSINKHSHEIPAKKNCLLEYELSKPEARKEAELQKRFNKKFKLTGKATHICKIHGELPITNFNLSKNRYGKYYPSNHCQECETKKAKKPVRKSERDKFKVRSYVRSSQSKARQGLADFYIKKLLGKRLHGLNDEQKKELIEAKRVEILQLRLHLETIRSSSKSIEAQRGHKHITELRDWYVRRLIQSSAEYDGHEINHEELLAKKVEILAKRKGIVKKGNAKKKVPEKTKEEIKAYNRNRANHHAAILSNAYLNGKIRGSKDYVGGKITDAQREMKRREILALRESKASGESKKTLTQRLSDSYIRSVIRNSKTYKGQKITKQVISEVRQRIIKKREKSNRILKSKK